MSADSQYDKTKPWQTPPTSVMGVSGNGPFAGNEERKTSMALAANTAPRDAVSQIPNPLPQRILFPKRYGYKKTQPNIFDIVNASRQYASVNDFSGANSQINSTSTNSLGTV